MFAKPFLSSWLLTFLVFVINYAGFSDAGPSWILDNQNNDYSKDSFPYQRISLSEQSSSATVTLVFNLPIIEQSAPTSTPLPMEGYPAPESGVEIVPGTPTPSPIPIQTGSVNVPIVIGALAIIIVILLAWFFLGYLPARNKGKLS